MNVLPTPSATIDDARVACVLARVVAVVNPLLDLLESDPVGLKARRRGSADPMGRALDAAAWALDVADVPGTQSWHEMGVDERVDWWVHRIGALNTAIVAFPGVLGAVADRLPIQDALGFASQAVVLCAVAREHDVTDRGEQVRLLAAVLCDRDLSAPAGAADVEPPVEVERSGRGVARALWEIAGQLRAINAELVKRSQPRRIFRMLGALPAVGAVADYLGEYGALVRAAKEGRAWLAQATPGRS